MHAVLSRYGVEYRVLSNFWLANEDYTQLVFELALAAIQGLENGHHLYNNRMEARLNMMAGYRLENRHQKGYIWDEFYHQTGRVSSLARVRNKWLTFLKREVGIQ